MMLVNRRGKWGDVSVFIAPSPPPQPFVGTIWKMKYKDPPEVLIFLSARLKKNSEVFKFCCLFFWKNKSAVSPPSPNLQKPSLLGGGFADKILSNLGEVQTQLQNNNSGLVQAYILYLVRLWHDVCAFNFPELNAINFSLEWQKHNVWTGP